ncbi:MAG TPA: hypothetical protein VF698_12045, partial [Thermoanaerobaculia bacterium]
ADHVARYRRYTTYAVQHGHGGVDFVDFAQAIGMASPMAGRSGRDSMTGAAPLRAEDLGNRYAEPFLALWQRIAMRVTVPAPMFFAGIEYVGHHSQYGHTAFLFGERSSTGWWHYFPVVVFFKTPLAFLLLALAGVVLLRRNAVALAPLLILGIAMTNNINIGVRHVLPICPMLTICAAYAAVRLYARSRIAIVVLLGWYLIATALAHPDYLAYFNELAGRHPERIAVDSNLDWGQDLLRLRDLTRREKLEPLHLAYFGTVDWRRLDLDAEPLPPNACRTGWIAAAETQLALVDGYEWLSKRDDYRRIGKSIRLYRVGRCD